MREFKVLMLMCGAAIIIMAVLYLSYSADSENSAREPVGTVEVSGKTYHF